MSSGFFIFLKKLRGPTPRGVAGMGRTPVPTKLKLLRGNPGGRPMPQGEPEPVTDIPSPPDHLSDDAVAEWGRISIELRAVGLISQIDRSALAAYCQAYGRWCSAERLLAENGMLVKTTNGNIIQSPLVGIANKSLDLMHKFLTEFGMTPASRSKVSSSAPKGENKFTKYAKK